MSTQPVAGTIFGAQLTDVGWLKMAKVARPVKTGELTKRVVEVPQEAAQKLLTTIIRFVVDVPAGANLHLVWQDGGSELSVDAGSTTITCTEGLVTVTVTVDCDQLEKPFPVPVPIAVGRPDAPAGLVMSAYERVVAPDLIADLWSGPLTAFAWEAVLELARRLCADVGKDAQGRPLVPGAIAAGQAVLLLQPMARHDLSAIGG